MTSTYVGRGFSTGQLPQAQPPPKSAAATAAPLPTMFPVRPAETATGANALYGGGTGGGGGLNDHPFPTTLGGRGGVGGFGGLFPKDNDEDDRRSERSDRSHSSRGSHRSSHSSGSRHRHSSSYEDYEPSSSSESDNEGSSSQKEQAKEAEEAFYDHRFIWATGFFLLIAAAAYFYWITTWECCTVENEETNMTMQYAIDQFLRSKTELKVSPANPAADQRNSDTEPGAAPTQEGEVN